MTTKKVITNNIKYNGLGRGVGFVVNFALLPFIVAHVGNEVYGAYILVMTFTGYLGVLDFGVTSAVVKYVAEYMGKKDREGTRRIISASFSFYIVIGLIAAILLFILSFYFQDVFKIESASVATARQLFWVAAGASLLVWPSRLFDGVLQGLQSYGWRAANDAGASVLTGIAAYLIFAVAGGGMVYFLAASFGIMLLKNLSAYVIGHHHLLKVRLIFPYYDRRVFRTIFSFSLFIFLASVTGIVIFQVDDIVIGAFVSVSAVTLYAAGYSLQNGFRLVNSIIGGPLFPAAAEMEGKGDYQKQKALLFKGTRYMTLVFVPAVIIVIVLAPPLIRHWMGISFEESVLPAQVLVALWLFNGTAEVASGMLTAKGYVRIKFNISLATAIVNLALSLILVRYLGIVGVALGTLIGMAMVEFPLIIHFSLKVLGITYREYFLSAISRNLAVYFLAAALSALAIFLLSPGNLILVLLEMGAIYGITLLSGFLLSLSSEERREVLAMVGW